VYARRLAEWIVIEPVEWLVPGWIPLGVLTVLDGDPGLGKSTLLIDIAARVTSHGMLFNNQQGPIGTVILMSAEDPAENTIRPRLEAAGAYVERIGARLIEIALADIGFLRRLAITTIRLAKR
jgi:RecA-family ATPase